MKFCRKDFQETVSTKQSEDSEAQWKGVLQVASIPNGTAKLREETNCDDAATDY